jgi:hypothetical protein
LVSKCFAKAEKQVAARNMVNRDSFCNKDLSTEVRVSHLSGHLGKKEPPIRGDKTAMRSVSCLLNEMKPTPSPKSKINQQTAKKYW